MGLPFTVSYIVLTGEVGFNNQPLVHFKGTPKQVWLAHTSKPDSRLMDRKSLWLVAGVHAAPMRSGTRH